MPVRRCDRTLFALYISLLSVSPTPIRRRPCLGLPNTFSLLWCWILIVLLLHRFLPFCAINIKAELEHGASSIRTTSSSRPLASDATLHWSKFTWICFHDWLTWNSNRPRDSQRNSLQVCYFCGVLSSALLLTAIIFSDGHSVRLGPLKAAFWHSWSLSGGEIPRSTTQHDQTSTLQDVLETGLFVDWETSFEFAVDVNAYLSSRE